MIKLFTIFTFGIISPYWIAYILTLILGLTTIILFYLLAVKLIGELNAKLALILFISFPTAFVLHAAYTENLFLTLTLLSFWLLEKKRFLLSSLVGGLTVATRQVGIGMSVVYLFIKAPLRKKIIYSLFALSGLLGYMLFLKLQFGDPYLFANAHQEWCTGIGQCKITFPLSPLLPKAQLLLAGWVRPNFSISFLDWISPIIFLALLWPIYKHLNKTYLIYSAVAILLPLSTGMLTSMTRYIFVAFPIFLILPVILKSKWLIALLVIFFSLLQLKFISEFTNFIWVV